MLRLLRVRTATGAPVPEAAPAPVPAPAPPPAPAPAPKTVLRGLDLPKGLDRPVLVYFHWPHEDGARGKQVLRFCNGALDGEAFVLLSSLFHCVEVNTRDSEPRLVEEAKVRTTPSLMVCRPDLSVVWRTEDATLGGKELAAALRRVLKEQFPGRWAAVEKEAADQKVRLAAARKLLAAGDLPAATAALATIVDSDVRTTEEWADARRLLRDAERKAAAAPAGK